jgi:hypothetical protein
MGKGRDLWSVTNAAAASELEKLSTFVSCAKEKPERCLEYIMRLLSLYVFICILVIFTVAAG